MRPSKGMNANLFHCRVTNRWQISTVHFFLNCAISKFQRIRHLLSDGAFRASMPAPTNAALQFCKGTQDKGKIVSTSLKPNLLVLSLLLAVATAGCGDGSNAAPKTVASTPLTSTNTLAPSPSPAPADNFATENQKLVNFLVQRLVVQGSPRFQGVEGTTPTGYYSNNIAYWGDYVCGRANCTVVDKVLTEPMFSLVGKDPDAEGAKLQMERAFTVSGANIYDTATWQIGAALGVASKESFKMTHKEMIATIDRQNQRLNKWQTKAIPCVDQYVGSKKIGYNGVQCDYAGAFVHGYEQTATVIANLQFAYNFRMLGPDFIFNDPFIGTPYLSRYVSIENSEKYDEKFTAGQISWADWKPISGENGWALLLGPLQAKLLLSQATGTPIAEDDLAIRNAINFVWALQRMQSDLGAIYYATNGSQGNTGKDVPSGEISVENNVSLLAGLNVLRHLLETYPKTPGKPEMTSVINAIDIMLWGGKMPQGGKTSGLLNYLRTRAYNAQAGLFSQGGTYTNGIYSRNDKEFALDVNTWGLSALGPQTVESWYGAGAAYKIWKNARALAGYCQGPDSRDNTGACLVGQLWGVGYSTQREVETTINGVHYDQQVMSSEWTAGAINTVNALIEYYVAHPGVITDEEFKALQTDKETMLQHLVLMGSDQYPTAGFAGTVEKKYLSTVENDEIGYLYGSRRYNIPFGWYANPIPNTASTAWVIMLRKGFDPFRYNNQLNNFTDTSKPSYNDQNSVIYRNSERVTVINKLIDPGSSAVQYTTPVVVSSQLNEAPLTYRATINGGIYAEFDLTSINSQEKLLFNFLGPDRFQNACLLSVFDLRKKIANSDPLQTAIIVEGHDQEWQNCQIISKSP